jgi:carboxylesterase type B
MEIYHRSFLLSSPKTYRYLFDAPNPFAPELGAHHAVDLLYLFGGIKLLAQQEALRNEMRRIWVRFVAGAEPRL